MDEDAQLERQPRSGPLSPSSRQGLTPARVEYPKTTRAAVATALRRLVRKGLAEKRGNKMEGVEFRRKDATKT